MKDINLKALVERMPFGMMTVRLDASGDGTEFRIIHANPEAAVETRVDFEPLIGKTLREAFPESTDLSAPAALAACLQDQKRRDLGEISYGDDAFDVQAVPLDERDIAILYTHVGDRKQAEDNVLRLHAEKVAAEEANRAKTVFLANLSHEIRTPLNGVTGMTHVLLQSNLTSEQRSGLQVIESSSRALLTIVNNVLDISSIEAGRFTLVRSQVRVSSLVRDVVHLFQDNARRKNVAVRVELDARLPRSAELDGPRLRSVLTNLVGNAVKFTDAGHVWLRAMTCPGEDGPMIRFEVEDSGIGISEEDIKNLFQPFAQADAAKKRSEQGTGLGLTICRRLVGLMGGEIGLVSKPGAGSTFWLTIAYPESTCQPAESTDPRAAGLGRVFACGSTRQFHQFVDGLLDVGVNVESYSDAVALMAAMRKEASGEAPSAVIVEQPTPGVEACILARLLRQADGSLPPLLMWTAAVEGNRQDAAAAGYAAIVSGDVSATRSLDALDQVVHSKGKAAFVVVHSEEEENSEQVMNGRVLVAEDVEVNAQVVSLLLDKWGYEVVVATDGQKAIEAFTEGEFDLVLMDCQMPEKDGWEATQEIRTLEHAHQHTPIVGLTAHVTTEHLQQCIDAGMDSYVLKPIDPSCLRDSIDTHVAASKLSPDARVLNPLTALRRVGGNLTALQMLLQGLQAMVPEKVEQIRVAMESNDSEKVTGLAHALKGAGSNLAAADLARAAGDLEAAGRAANQAAMVAAFEQLEHHCKALQSILEGETEEVSSHADAGYLCTA